jgi:hypothetical protein
MAAFAKRTGVDAPGGGRRYLWTDAFAVCNFLALQDAAQALRLIDRVHHTLGRHRPDDARGGWLSGLPEAEGEAQPTRGGLRIGKPLPERAPGEAPDDRLEWERDGQYFHYLTKWMHALDQAARVLARPELHRWARELAARASEAFTYVPAPGATRRMYWKMSVDLSRPLVASMGQHDPLDGLVTAVQLDVTAAHAGWPTEPRLDRAVAEFAAMIDPRQLGTSDPLGIGGLLVDAYRLVQLGRQRGLTRQQALVEEILAAALAGVEHVARGAVLHARADQRLAFRELGLAIGLAAAERLVREVPAAGPAGAGTREVLRRLARHGALRESIERCWLEPDARASDAWLAHQDINDVMLATALVPEGLLVVGPAPGS